MSVNMKEPKDLLKMVLHDMGGKIEERDDEYIWVRVNGSLQLYCIANETVTREFLFQFSRNTEQIKVTKAIFCMKGYKPDVTDMASNSDIELISREDIEKLIGKYLLQRLEHGEEVSILDEEDVSVEDFEVENEEEQDMDTIPIIIEDIGGGEEKIIKITVSEDEALKIARRHLQGFDTELNLLPYYVFEYTLKIVVEGELEDRTISGIIALDGITGNYEIWKTGYETVSSIGITYIKKEPKIGLDKSKKAAKESLIKEFTTEKEITIEDENVTIIEKRKTRPLENSIKINYMGLYYLPVWIIGGRKGNIILNASTGKIMKENIYGSSTI